MLIENVKLNTTREKILGLSSWSTINHGIFTRNFGSLKSNQPDTREKLNRIRLLSKSNYAVKMLPQHGTTVTRVIDDSTDLQPAIKTDALVHFRKNGNGRKPVLVSNSADCYSVLLASTDRMAIGVIHCSLKNTTNGVIENVMESLSKEDEQKTFTAGIMPGICADCYEIGEADKSVGESPNYQSGRFDLKQEIIDRLSKFPELIKSISHSTVCSKEDERIFSHRRREEGRSPCFISY